MSESKFQANPAAFIPHIRNPNRAALEALIVKPEVERALLARIRKKAALYARELDMRGEPVGDDLAGSVDSVPRGDHVGAESIRRTGRFKVDIDAVEHLYAKYLIPLTKEVEVVCRLLRDPLIGSLIFSRSSICYSGWMVCRKRRYRN